MSSLQKRKAKPQVSPAVEVIDLLREAVDHLAAIRAMMVATQAPVSNEAPPPHEVIDPNDLITPQQAAGIANKDATTMRRWQREFDIGTVIGGTPFIFKSKLLAHLAHVAPPHAV